MKTFKLLSFLFLIAVSSCQIVEEDTIEEGPDMMETPDDGGANVDLGSQEIPSDSATFVNLIHGENSRTWRAEEFTLESLSGFQDCRLDDLMTLHSNGTFEYDGGQVLCFGEDDRRMRTGTFTIDPANAQITFTDEAHVSYVAQVVTLEEGEIVLRGVYESFLGDLDVAGRYLSE